MFTEMIAFKMAWKLIGFGFGIGVLVGIAIVMIGLYLSAKKNSLDKTK